MLGRGFLFVEYFIRDPLADFPDAPRRDKRLGDLPEDGDQVFRDREVVAHPEGGGRRARRSFPRLAPRRFFLLFGGRGEEDRR